METSFFQTEDRGMDCSETIDTKLSIDVNDDKNVICSDPGTHFYGETVSKTVSSIEMYDFMVNIFIQSSLGNLPKSTPEEIRQLLNERFDKTLAKNVEPQLPEQSTTPIEDYPEQFVCNHFKRQRVDSDV